MTIKIVLPEGRGAKIGRGTKVYTADGAPITGITKMNIFVGSGEDDIITATLEVFVESIENLDGIATLLPPDEAKKVIEWARRQSSTATAA